MGNTVPYVDILKYRNLDANWIKNFYTQKF